MSKTNISEFIINQIFLLTRDWSKLGYLSLDIICSSKLKVFLELCFLKTVRFSEQIMSVDKYPSIFSHKMETIVYIFWHQKEAIVFIIL